jgi:hypothetical protein
MRFRFFAFKQLGTDCSLSERRQRRKTEQACSTDVKSGAPIYLIASKQKTIDTAITY